MQTTDLVVDDDGCPLPSAPTAGCAPCPFCATAADSGKMALVEIAEDDDGTPLWAVLCLGCNAGGPLGATPRAATAKWNREETAGADA